MSARCLREPDARALSACIAGGGIALIPTDTVYGLACDPESEEAVRRLYALKGRKPDKPAAVMFFALEHALAHLGALPERVEKAVAALLPGPVTLLLENPSSRFPLACDPARRASTAVLGVRVPRWRPEHASLRSVSLPVLQSSANLSGGADPCELDAVPASMRSSADLVLDGGELPGVASTVLDLTSLQSSGRWRLLRDGALSAREAELALAHVGERC